MKAAVALAMALSAPLAATALDFKGIEVGAPATREQVRERIGTSCNWLEDDSAICDGNVTVAQEPAFMHLVIDSAGVVQRIDLTLASKSFDVVADELAAKFGKPRTQRGVVQNHMGARFEQVTHTWRGSKETTLVATKYATRVDYSAVSFTTKAARTEPRPRRGDI